MLKHADERSVEAYVTDYRVYFKSVEHPYVATCSELHMSSPHYNQGC